MSRVRNDVSVRVALQPERAVLGHVSVESGLRAADRRFSMSKRTEQSPAHDLDPGNGRVSVVTPRNTSAEPPAGAVAAAPFPVLDADRDVGRAAAERGAAPETSHRQN
jgi:hypothetical protein